MAVPAASACTTIATTTASATVSLLPCVLACVEGLLVLLLLVWELCCSDVPAILVVHQIRVEGFLTQCPGMSTFITVEAGQCLQLIHFTDLISFARALSSLLSGSGSVSHQLK